MVVSFVIPCYNAAKTLREAVSSIERTCSVPYEIIIVNDGSTDDTEQVATEILQRNRYAQLINQSNKGVNAARELGWSKSSGDYICFLDADDKVILSDVIFDWLTKEYDIVKAGGWYQTCKQRIGYANGYNGEVTDVLSAYTLLLDGDILPYIHSAFFHREVITEECFNIDPRFKIGEDLLFNIKVMSHCHKFICVEEKFYSYLMNEDSVMHTKIWGFDYIRDFNNEMEKLIVPHCPELRDKLTLHRFIDYTSTFLFPEVKLKHTCYIEAKHLLEENHWLKKYSPKKNVLFIENELVYNVYVKLFRLLQRLRGKKRRIVLD